MFTMVKVSTVELQTHILFPPVLGYLYYYIFPTRKMYGWDYKAIPYILKVTVLKTENQ